MDVTARYLSEPATNGLVTRLARVGLLVDAFQHRCLDPFGLHFIDYSVLRVLQLAGPPYQMAPTELSEVVLRSSGGMTKILDRLEQSGLVGRTADPADRRKVLVGLTDDGLRAVDRAGASYAKERARVFGALDQDEVALLDAGLRRLLELLEHEAGVR